ncbi:MAG: YgiQ family radical SAM protein, partial [Erysipelotrichales bacterium]
MGFLPVTRKDMFDRGWEAPDFVLVSGDAYVDHPSFGTAIIGRVLEAMNFNVCILAQPDWKSDIDFTRFPKPKLGFLVTAGNIDSMVNHYTVSRKRRDKDNYTDKGEMGKRPDRATIVYAQNLRRIYPDSPIILGGIEASLRRMSHYDFWDDKVRASILIDAMADLLVYGMGENTIVEIAEAMRSGLAIQDITYVRGMVWKSKDGPFPDDAI